MACGRAGLGVVWAGSAALVAAVMAGGVAWGRAPAAGVWDRAAEAGRAAEAVRQPAGEPVLEPVSDRVKLARDLSDAFAGAAERVGASVVHITTARLEQRVTRDLFSGRRMRSGEPEFVQSGLGSGVIVAVEGESSVVLTNNHVIDRSDRFIVKLADGREVEADLVGTDPSTDLAVLRIPVTDVRAAEMADSDALRVGEWVLALGSPLGFDQTVTAGIVSAKNRRLNQRASESYEEYIQTDASINPGNSGGPLVDLDGRVVGINTAIASGSGGSVGLGFAVPSRIVSEVLRAILETGRVERGWLGTTMSDVTPAMARELGLPARGAVRVEGVVPGSPAERAGLRTGDLILGLGERESGNLNRLRNLISLTRPGTLARVRVWREGRTIEVTAEMGDRRSGEHLMLVSTPGIEFSERLGGYFVEITDEVREDLGVPELTGVFVRAVREGGVLAGSGLTQGDIIIGVDRKQVATVADVERRLDGRAITRGVRVDFIRGGRSWYVVVGGQG